MNAINLDIQIESQPSDTSCGPTCLAAVYRYWGQPIPIPQLITEIGQLEGGGTLAVDLGCDALRRGFDVSIVTFNLQLFDPTWFNANGDAISSELLADKLRSQREAKRNYLDIDQLRLAAATETYLEFLELGGRVRMLPMETDFITASLADGVPILCGLSATYLYRESRERAIEVEGLAGTVPDDVEGYPTGHFVVLHGFCEDRQIVRVADPMHPNPMASCGKYEIAFPRVAYSILLGIVTYDANLLTIQPRLAAK